MNESYVNTVRQLLAIAPTIFKEPKFAIKGGTALNLLVQDMPRLSVDIDVVFTDHTLARADALDVIAGALQEASTSLGKRGYTVRIPKKEKGEELKLLVQGPNALVKVEVNCVFRGTLHPVAVSPLAKATQDMFTTDLSLPVLHTAELYGSKLVAAMDRQHPRDLFDVRLMLDSVGLSPEIVSCFVAYLAGHNRPVHEVLFSNFKPEVELRTAYENDFEGMTLMPVPLETLLGVQKEIHHILPRALSEAERTFLLSLVRLEPDWDLMPYPHLKDLPAVQWKLQNLTKLKKAKPRQFDEQFLQLEERFNTMLESESA